MTYRQLGRALGVSFWGVVLWFACKSSDDQPQPLADRNTEEAGSSGVGGSRAGTSGAGGGSSGAAGAAPDASIDASDANCGDLECRGAGRCVVTNGTAQCVCDPGYVLADAGACIVDEHCINLRLLEKSCRQRLAAEPALGIFFGLETCAGTTVQPDVLGSLDHAFKVLEDGKALGDESYVALFQREVESYVSIALDLSGSLQRDESTLVQVIARLKQMVQSLRPAPGAPLVHVELLLFGRDIKTAQPFTTDLDAVATTLDQIQAHPADAGPDPGGTNLFGVVNYGMGDLDDAMKARFDETLGAIVTTGTMVTITDGRDSSGVTLKTLEARLNFISVGISNDIDDTELTQIGPQGSFLAPQQADWTDAFNRVAQRVLEYPQRSYLLGYCSPAVAGTHQVTVTLAAQQTNASATCSFDAQKFGVDQGVCNQSFINGYCEARTCGSFLACGQCASDGGTPQQGLDDHWDFAQSN